MGKLPLVSTEPIDIKIDKRRPADRKLFAKKVLENNMNTKETMRQLSHKGITDKALSNKLNRWLADPEVIKAISYEYDNLQLTTKDTKNVLSAVLFKTILKDDTKDSDRIAGCMAQAKIQGIVSESAQTNIAVLSGDQVQGLIGKYRSEKSEPLHIVDDLQYAQDIDE